MFELFRSYLLCKVYGLSNFVEILRNKSIFVQDLSKCEPMPDNNNPRATCICFVVVYAPLAVHWRSSGWNHSYSPAFIEVHQSCVWWGRTGIDLLNLFQVGFKILGITSHIWWLNFWNRWLTLLMVVEYPHIIIAGP